MAIFFGLSTMDVVYFLDELPGENKKSRASSFYVCSGGPSANAAITYSILSGECYLATPLGDGPIAKSIFEECLVYGVEVVDMAADRKVEPTVASIAVTGNGKNRTIWSYVPERDLFDVFPFLIDKKNSEKFVQFDGSFMADSIKIARLLKENGYSIVLDAGSWKSGSERLIPLCDVVIASESFKIPEGLMHGAKDSIDWISKNGVKFVAKTNDDRNIVGYSENSYFELSPPHVSAIDTLAAGDVFHGAFNYMFFCKKLNFIDSVYEASRVASCSCRYVGPRKGVLEYASNGF